MNNTENTSVKSTLWGGIGTFILLAVVGATLYFANVELQTYLGEKALAATGLELNSLDEALSKAAAEDKYVLADMSAIWCPACRKLDQEVLSKHPVKEAIAEKYIFARIEYESTEGKLFMEKYSVRGFPTLVILDSNGNLIKKLPRTFDPDKFLTLI